MAREESSLNQPRSAPKRRRRQDGEAQLLRFLLKLVAVAVISWVLLTYVLGIFVVHSNDMFPALRDGDLCITWKLRKPVYGDIVSYNYDGTRRFGRVVGMPGDVIDIDDESGAYTLNGLVPGRVPDERLSGQHGGLAPLRNDSAEFYRWQCGDPFSPPQLVSTAKTD